MKSSWSRPLLSLAFVAIFSVTPSLAQSLSGTIFHDRNANGIQDAGEEALDGVSMRLYGQQDAGGTFDQLLTTATNGAYSFSPGNGCYLLDIDDPPGWRRTRARADLIAEGTPGYTHPVGQRRFAVVSNLLDNLLAGQVRYTAIGDSIAWNWNSCFDTSSFWYSQQIRDRLRCVAPAATVSLDEGAIKGEHTDDLLVDEEGEFNNVFRAIDAQSQLVSISIIGNDLLDIEPGSSPTQEEVNRAVIEVLDARDNLQEILSSLLSELPTADVELNTLYDNLAYACNSDPFHVEWMPIVNQMLRELAWGQDRRVTNAEVFAEFGQQDLLGSCTGFDDQICLFLDGIHPRESGYEIIREKLWESLGGANLGPRDANNAPSIGGADHGYLERVLRLYPTQWDAQSGAVVQNPENALDGNDGGAAASVQLGIGDEQFRLSGFPGWYDEVVPVKVVAGVRYRTTGGVTDDFYRFEASRNATFRHPAGHDFSTTDWNFFTPIVGGGGPNAPVTNPDYGNASMLVTPNVASYRTASATLTKNPVLSADGRGYDWPWLTNDEIGTAQIRLVAAPVAGTPGDAYDVIVDSAWLDVYGTRKDRPAEVVNVLVDKQTDDALDVSFDELTSSQRYNVYFGSLASLGAGIYDHGDGAQSHQACDTPTTGTGRLTTTVPAIDVPAGPSYLLVTGHVDDVESPTGSAVPGDERDRSQNICP